MAAVAVAVLIPATPVAAQAERVATTAVAMAEAMVAANVTADNVGEVLQVAYYLDSGRLKKACLYFASTNFAAVRRTPAYKQMQPELRRDFDIHVFDNT